MKKRKIKWKNVILFIFIIMFSICLIISLIDIIKWIINNDKTNKQINLIKDIVNIEEIINNNVNNIINEDDYLDYIDVDLDKLINLNNDVVGWIKVNGTNIDYPYVKTNNNSFYLNHSFDKSYNEAGWVFLDYRNNNNLNHKNNIIYAHSRLDKTMFGSLSNIFKEDCLNNSKNHYIKISTKEENSIWQIFSVYIIPTTSDYLQIDFNNNEEFINFVNMLIKRSNYNFNISLDQEDKILTLSTCYNEEKKIVVHAKKYKRIT